MRRLTALVLTIWLCLMAGCANPGIVQRSPGVYELVRGDHAGIFGTNDALRAEVIRDANAFAENQGKVAVPVSARVQIPAELAYWTYFTYDFKVVDKGSPEAKAPRMLVPVEPVDNLQNRLFGRDFLYTAQPVQFPKESLTVSPDATGH